MSAISRVSSFQPRSGVDMTAFINLVVMAINEEMQVSDDPNVDDAISQLRGYMTSAISANDPKKIAKLFGNIKESALDAGATKTANAVTKSAKWFYENVEEPKPSYSLTPTDSGDDQEGGGGGEEEPFYTQTWFLVAAPVTLAVLIGVGILLWPSDRDN